MRLKAKDLLSLLGITSDYSCILCSPGEELRLHLLNCDFVFSVWKLITEKFSFNSQNNNILDQAKELLTSRMDHIQMLAAKLAIPALFWHTWREKSQNFSKYFQLHKKDLLWYFV